MSGRELKPCPFCGDAMELWDFNTHARHIDSDRKCPLASHAIRIEAWNRRTPDPAQIRADAIREAAAVDWSHGTDVFDKAPEFLTPWQRGLVAGQIAMRAAILALLDTPLSPTDAKE